MKRIFLAVLAATLFLSCFASASAEGETEAINETVIVKSLTLNRTKAVWTLKKGEAFPAFALTAKVTPDSAQLTWASSDETVATVDETGFVTSVGFGTAVITVSAEGGKTASCTLSVKKVVVSGVSFSKKSETIAAGEDGAFGEQLQLKAAVSPKDAFDGSLLWSSSDETVATVDENGLVTSVGLGTAVITATAADGAKSASCTVTVANVRAKKLALNTARLSLEGGQTYQLNPSFTPANATSKEIKWQSSNPTVVTVDESGLVTARKKGTAKVYAVAADGSRVTAQCTVKALSNALILESGEAKDPIFYGNVYDLYSPLGADVEQLLRAYYNTLGKDRAARILKKALEYAGVGYAYVDCSRLTKTAYKAGGYNIPRVSDDQAYALRNRAVERSELKPGDLIFFKKLPEELCSCGARCRRYLEIHHVGIYFGYVDGYHYIIDASSVIGKIVIRRWDGGDSFAEMLYAFAARR